MKKDSSSSSSSTAPPPSSSSSSGGISCIYANDPACLIYSLSLLPMPFLFIAPFCHSPSASLPETKQVAVCAAPPPPTSMFFSPFFFLPTLFILFYLSWNDFHSFFFGAIFFKVRTHRGSMTNQRNLTTIECWFGCKEFDEPVICL